MRVSGEDPEYYRDDFRAYNFPEIIKKSKKNPKNNPNKSDKQINNPNSDK